MSPPVPTHELFDAYVDAVMQRIIDNEEILVPKGLPPLTVIEGDEEPNRLDKFPQIRVIPLIGEGDRIEYPQGGDELSVIHHFTTKIYGFYEYRDISSGLRPTREYAYNCLDLFTGSNQYVQAVLDSGIIFGVATVDGSQVQVAYRRSGDKIIHAFVITLNQIGA